MSHWTALTGLTLQHPDRGRPWSPCRGAGGGGCRGDAGSGGGAGWAAPCWTAASAGSLWRRWSLLWELCPLWSEELKKKEKSWANTHSDNNVLTPEGAFFWYLSCAGWWVEPGFPCSDSCGCPSLSVLQIKQTGSEEEHTGSGGRVCDKSGQNLLEFLGRPGPMETCRTFPLGFRTASSPWPTWNWICLDPEELNGPQPPFLTLNSRLEDRDRERHTVNFHANFVFNSEKNHSSVLTTLAAIPHFGSGPQLFDTFPGHLVQTLVVARGFILWQSYQWLWFES